MAAGGVDPLALGLEHAGDRVLGEPVDLQVGMQAAELSGDRSVALRVAEADRGRDVEGTGPTVGAIHRRIAWRAFPLERVLGEVTQREVDLDRLARVREMARAADDL